MESVRKHKVDIVISLLSLLIALVFFIDANKREISIAIISLLLSYLLAKHFGDVAGQKAARDYAEEEAKKSRIIAIKSLLNEVQRVRYLAKKNSELVVADRVYNTRGAVRMPMIAFETALVSRESALLGESRDTPDFAELLAAITEYLTEAYSINALIEIRIAAISSLGTGPDQRTEITQEIKVKSDNLSKTKTLDRLEKCLGCELEKVLSE